MKAICERRCDEGLRVFSGDYVGAIRTIDAGGDKRVIENNTSSAGYRIRKLTPRECWRLMDFTDEDFDKAQAAGISNSQLYKQAGNSIVVSVPYFIFKELYKAMPYLFEDLKVGSYFSGIGAIEKALDRLYEDINQNENDGTETEFTPRSNRDVIIYDDYNSRVRADQETIGTLTTNIGASSIRSAFKLIER